MPRLRQSSKSQFPDGAADVARRFGITIKTLRLYENAGLIRPVRDGHGWRTYGQTECERLHVVLLLRRFGLTISRIGELLESRSPDLTAVIDLQERALRDQRGRIDEALTLIRRARGRLLAGEAIDPAALAELARAEPLRMRWTPALEKLATETFTPDQQRRLARIAPAIEIEWNALYHELDELSGGAPDTPRARALGRKAAALIARMTGGDDAMRGALTRFWRDGFADPALSASLPMDAARWRFLGAAMAAAAGEGQ
ncbi:MerR family transcriptional regulator [Sphingomonas sp. AR_OL41]|uniref:MerR family transcriptional regulator n=1 Tax=Sphingomonas sp. AR_OL41 TaxID=3042729 RepID=UPI002480FC99|nr:MerR family transcriptional regulator [Sphingomonas sp. AR_OL41]MDH7971266.1 MerR family transcriptional regulator [Sphingomonas sp. AR_OL41]